MATKTKPATSSTNTAQAQVELVALRYLEPWERLSHQTMNDVQRLYTIFYKSGYSVRPLDLQTAWREYSAEQLMDWHPLPQSDEECFQILIPMFGKEEDSA